MLNWSACSSDWSPTENIWYKVQQNTPQAVEQMQTSQASILRKKTFKEQQLEFSIPKSLQSVVKTRGESTEW